LAAVGQDHVHQEQLVGDQPKPTVAACQVRQSLWKQVEFS
jgi:hypothetical protein